MRLTEGSIQISSQMLTKSLKEVPILVLGLIFIGIHRGLLLGGPPTQTLQSMDMYLILSGASHSDVLRS